MNLKIVVSTLLAASVMILNLDDPSKTIHQAPADGPQYTKDNRLMRPAGYRSWVYLSSSLGLQYGPGASPANPSFENVYVNPTAYAAFEKTGKWPDKTIFILEIRRSMDKGTFAKGGRYQGEITAVEAAVKDESRFPEKWAYFDLGTRAESAEAIPKTASCFSCHTANAAVENSFAQFYPTVFAIAEAKGTLNPGYLQAQEARDAAAPHPSTEPQPGATAPKTTTPDDEVSDLVCNMQINKRAMFKSLYKDATYYFCSSQCKSDFDRAPLQFIKTEKK
jgi:YHS domain-containing protein